MKKYKPKKLSDAANGLRALRVVYRARAFSLAFSFGMAACNCFRICACFSTVTEGDFAGSHHKLSCSFFFVYVMSSVIITILLIDMAKSGALLHNLGGLCTDASTVFFFQPLVSRGSQCESQDIRTGLRVI
jgi:hypothetical protein